MATGAKGWKDPSKGSTKKRETMPANVFLDSKNKKYPVKKKSRGQWKYSRSGLMAALSRAAAQHQTSIVATARRILKREFGYEAKN